ncbi:nuclear transport factor 2 family protein [Sporosarcina sp. Marseille-Q4063]|uniref:nuclear transport factor 2 family protein n=1 Tax=Sporosarcina sp. Marseille-Q4063 TaxID=2810514 RepID=UPI001BB02487|nr:nuclear transport factor 2 family protein [Sporosarcina sp. Marseille-Q4063]QUW21621.1 nuclear transport factor 2 family protein [Sporosarcina sp. Marseille-Q4063]
MKKFYIAIVVGILFVLGACSADKNNSSEHGSVEDGETTTNNGAIDHGVDDKQVGFNMSGGKIEEAADVPDAEKEQILEAFTIYIDAFNEKDIDKYMETLSKHSEVFDLEEERSYMGEQFKEYDLNREVSDTTIVKYSEKEAQVFATLKTTVKQISSGLEFDQLGRQVTVFTKDDGNWKVSAIHYIGDEKSK